MTMEDGRPFARPAQPKRPDWKSAGVEESPLWKSAIVEERRCGRAAL
jgi:hypothetical protein